MNFPSRLDFRIIEFPPALPSLVKWMQVLAIFIETTVSDLSCSQLHNSFLESQSLCPLDHLIGLDRHHGCQMTG